MTSIQTTLAKNPNYYKETLDLIELSFLYTPENSYETDFYPLMEPSNHKNNHILIKDKKVVGHIGVQLRPLGWADFQTPAALLGGITIHPNYRGKGLLKDFLEAVLKQYEEQVCFFLLWSDLDKLYEKFGFHQAGGHFQTGNKDFQELEGFKKTSFPSLSEQEFEQIQKLYNESIGEYFTSFRRGERDWSNIKEMASVDVYIKDTEEDIKAYFCHGKGQDLNQVIHEIAAPFNDFDKLIAELQEYKVWLPEIYNQFFKREEIMYSAFFKVANRKRFSDFINGWSRGEVILFMQDGKTITFTHKNGPEHNCSEAEFLTFIFGPNPLTEFQEYGRPLFISGLDSV